MIFLICLVVIFVFLLVCYRQTYTKFDIYGVKYIKPVPFVGNIGSMALKKSHFVELLQELYTSFPDDRFVIRLEMTRPVVVIRDLNLIKQITVEDFEHFHDHRTMVDESVDPLFGRCLFSLKGQEWKDMRSTLSPALTGSKVRAMIPFMIEATDQMIRILKKKLVEAEPGYADVDSKDLTTRYCNDVMASCGFGLKVDSHADPENEFYLQAKSTAHLSLRRILVYLGYTAFPSIMKKLNIKFFCEEANNYFKNLFANTIEERERKNILRPDIIHYLMKARKGNVEPTDKVQINDTGFATVEESEVGRRNVNRLWSDNDLLSQAVFFFLASIETASTAMCFALYELAVNSDVQEKLLKEFRDNEENNNGFDFDSIQDLKYFDMVISELFRKWPIGVETERVCTKDYNLGRPNDKATSDYIIKKGDLIGMPMYCIHNDPNYFHEPERFDPERFSEVNRGNIKPYSYLPFGSGPRNCIASRFALCELKVMLYHLLLHFEVSPAEKTRVPVKLARGALLLTMEGGHWIRFKLRK